MQLDCFFSTASFGNLVEKEKYPSRSVSNLSGFTVNTAWPHVQRKGVSMEGYSAAEGWNIMWPFLCHIPVALILAKEMRQHRTSYVKLGWKYWCHSPTTKINKNLFSHWKLASVTLDVYWEQLTFSSILTENAITRSGLWLKGLVEYLMLQ